MESKFRTSSPFFSLSGRKVSLIPCFIAAVMKRAIVGLVLYSTERFSSLSLRKLSPLHSPSSLGTFTPIARLGIVKTMKETRKEAEKISQLRREAGDPEAPQPVGERQDEQVSSEILSGSEKQDPRAQSGEEICQKKERIEGVDSGEPSSLDIEHTVLDAHTKTEFEPLGRTINEAEQELGRLFREALKLSKKKDQNVTKE
jgi:hypothetical protein